MAIKVAARGSKLSIIQVHEALENLRGEIDYSIITVKTKGDIERNKPLYKISGKGIFEKEVNMALFNGDVDLAIHSAKDMPLEDFDRRICILAVPKRGSRYDAILTKSGMTISQMPSGSIIGTSSIRRIAFLKYKRRDIIPRNIRGNIDTRIKKLYNNQYDAIIAAEAALIRLGVRKFRRLDLHDFIPAAGQGGILIVGLEDNNKINSIVRKVNDPPSFFEVMVEKFFISKLGIGCSIPLGVTSFVKDGYLDLIAGIVNPEFNSLNKVEWRIEIDYNKLCDLDYVREIAEAFIGVFKEKDAHISMEEWRRMMG
jgi:hydroxymethylbilane synthase